MIVPLLSLLGIDIDLIIQLISLIIHDFVTLEVAQMIQVIDSL